MIALISACGSNFSSVCFALERLGYEATLTNDAEKIKSASHVILPGVGHAAYAMGQLEKYDLIHVIPQLTQPVLGICLGMQLLFTETAEGEVRGLDVFSGKITPLPAKKGYTLPHMGWNQLDIKQKDSPLMLEVDNHAYVYFVHSYAAPIGDYTVAASHHSEKFSAIVAQDNFYATQFHLERSAAVGATVLTNFLKL
ncbi:MAG: imidazole glycerol phosphate synthase subunit HisH [Gammaproteobacteria bacterium]